MKEILPYIVAIASTIISGLLSYFSATKKASGDLNALKETNRLEIEKLMSQHKLDLEALERKHEMEKEKMDLEHKHKIELLRKETENAMGTNMMSSVLGEIFKAPEAKQMISEALQKKVKKM